MKKVGIGSVVAGLSIVAGLGSGRAAAQWAHFCAAFGVGVAALDGDAGMFNGNLYPSSYCTSGNSEDCTRREASCPLFVVVAFGGRIRLLFGDCGRRVCRDQLCPLVVLRRHLRYL